MEMWENLGASRDTPHRKMRRHKYKRDLTSAQEKTHLGRNSVFLSAAGCMDRDTSPARCISPAQR